MEIKWKAAEKSTQNSIEHERERGKRERNHKGD
jgi:hypothetical protein